jgi:transposase
VGAGNEKVCRADKQVNGNYHQSGGRLVFRLDDEAIYRVDKEILEEAAQQKLSPPPYAAHISVRENLTCRQGGYLNLLCELNEPIYKAMLLKESLLTVYSCENQDEAQIVLHRWIDEAAQSVLEPFIVLAKGFADKMQYILNRFIKKISSAISEGFNNKIKRLKGMACGYKDIDCFRLRIHQHCGLLNPRLNTVNAT